MSQTVQIQGTVTFSVGASSGTTMSYQWCKNGSSISGATLSSYTIATVQATDAGTYTAKVTNAGGSVTSSGATLTVNIPPTITTQPQNQAAAVGGNVTFSVVASGTAPLGYQWYFNGTALAGATGSALTLTNVQTNSAGSYSVVVTNIVGSAYSTNATLTVSPPGVVTMAASSITTNAALLNGVVNAQVLGPLLGYVTYYWQLGLTTNYTASTGYIIIAASTNGVGVTIVATNLTPGTWYHFNIVGTGVNGTSVGADMTFMTPFMPPAVTTLAANNITTNSATLNATVNPQGTTASYYFQYGLTTNYTAFSATNSLAAGTNAVATNAIISGLAPGTLYHYCVVAVSSGGTSIGSDATFTTTYLPPAVTILTANNITANSATLNATVNPQGATASYYFQYGLTTNYTSFSATNSLAAGTNAVATNAIISGLASGTLYHYCVVAVSSGGTSISSDAAFATTYLPPGITTQPTNLTVMQSLNAAFSVGASGTAPLGYQWNFNGTSLSGATNVSLALSNVQPAQAGGYSVVITNSAGSVTSAVATLSVIAVPPGSYVEAVITNRPLAYWPLNELSGTTAFDYVGGNNATYANVTLGQPGALATSSDTAASFNGTNAYAGTGVSLVNNRAAFTLEGWYKLVAGGTRMGFWGQNNAIEFGLSTPTNIQLYTAGGGTLNVTNTWGTNSWHYLAAVGNGTNLLLYVDGKLAGSGGSATNNYGSSTYPFNIGGGGVFDAGTNWFNGCLGEIAFYNRALPAADVQRHYLLGLALPALTLTAPTNNAIFTAPAAITLSATVVTNGHTITNVQFFNGATLLTTDTTSPYTYNWSGVGAGTYNVSAVATYDSGSVTSAVATVAAYVAPGIQTQPQNLTVTQGQSASFSVAANGSAPFSYQWSLNGSPLSGATDASLTLASAQGTDAGTYTVVVTNPVGSVTSHAATLTVNIPPGITTQPQSQTVVAGQSASFSVVASGTANLSYQWYLNGSSLSGGASQNATLALTSVGTANAGNYTVVVNNNWGSVTSAVAGLTVYVPAAITTQPQSQTTTQGLNAAFSVVASGTAPLAYQWSFNGAPLAGATSSALALTGVQTTNAGSYTVAVTNSWGAVTSAVATLTVYVPPAITAQPQSQAVTKGQNASFSVVASGSTPFTYQWYLNGSKAGRTDNQSTLALNNVNTDKAGNYTVVVANAAGSVTSVVATLTVYVPPGIQTQPQNLTVTQGQSASFAVVANGSAPFGYQWNFNGSPVSGATNASLTLASAQGTDAGSYTVAVTNPAGSVTSQVATLTVNIPAGITTQPQSQTVTQGQAASFSVVASGTPTLSYQWYLNGSSLSGGTSQNPTLALSSVGTNNAGSYTVVVNNNWGSVTSAVASLMVLVPAGITTQPQSQTATQGLSAAFSVVASGDAPLSYQWNFSGSPLSGATSSALALTNVQTTDAGSYTVVVTNSWGAVTSAVATLTVYVPPAITTQPQSQALTQGQNASVSVAASGSTPFAYQWYLNGSSLGGGGQSSTLALNNVSTDKAGNYTVVVANPAGSVTSVVATLTVYVLPGIQTQPQNLTVTQGQSASFAVVANGSAPFGYQWNFNGSPVSGATSSTLTLKSVQINNSGSYTVVVTNVAGSITSAGATLTVVVPPTILTQPQSQVVAAGQSATFSVTATGTDPLSYQWSLNGEALSGATSSTLTLNSVQTTDAGSYTVMVANPWGSAPSAAAVLTVTNPIIALSLPTGGGMSRTGFNFQVSVPVGHTYVILVTTNLRDWTPVYTNVALSDTVALTDPGATNCSKRFYRAMVQ